MKKPALIGLSALVLAALLCGCDTGSGSEAETTPTATLPVETSSAALATGTDIVGDPKGSTPSDISEFWSDDGVSPFKAAGDAEAAEVIAEALLSDIENEYSAYDKAPEAELLAMEQDAEYDDLTEGRVLVYILRSRVRPSDYDSFPLTGGMTGDGTWIYPLDRVVIIHEQDGTYSLINAPDIEAALNTFDNGDGTHRLIAMWSVYADERFELSTEAGDDTVLESLFSSDFKLGNGSEISDFDISASRVYDFTWEDNGPLTFIFTAELSGDKSLTLRLRFDGLFAWWAWGRA